MNTSKTVLLKTIECNSQKVIGLTSVTKTQDTHAKKNYNLHFVDSSKPLLHRLCFCFPEFLLEILMNNFQVILALRLVAKNLHAFCSTKNIACSSFNPLTEKTAILFAYEDLHPNFNPEVQEKWDFAIDNEAIELQIKPEVMTFMPDHLSLLRQSQCKMKNPIKFIFHINTNRRLHELNSIASNLSYSDSLIFLKKLDFSKLFIDGNNINEIHLFLNRIEENLKVFSNISTIIIGKVCHTVSLKIPESMQDKFIFLQINEEQPIFTFDNALKATVIGLGIYKVYTWFTKEPEDKKYEKDHV